VSFFISLNQSFFKLTCSAGVAQRGQATIYSEFERVNAYNIEVSGAADCLATSAKMLAGKR